MSSLKKCIFLLAIVCLSTLAVASDDPAKERHERMENIADAAKPLGAMLKGEQEYDADTVLESFTTMKEMIDGIDALFPEGSYEEGEKRASMAVWDNRADFDRHMAEFAVALDEAIAAKPQDLEALKPVAQEVFGSCKACHEDYRTPGD